MKSNLSDKIINICREAWDHDLVAGRSGNVSVRKEGRIIMSRSGSCLGMLCENDLIETDIEGNVKNDAKITSEAPLHLAIYKNTDFKAVLHLHSPYTSAYFSHTDLLEPVTFEERLILGKVPVIPQHTPTVTDIKAVIDTLKVSNIVVLKNHGVVSAAEDLLDALFLIQTLEHAVKMNIVARLINNPSSVNCPPNTLNPDFANAKSTRRVEPEQSSVQGLTLNRPDIIGAGLGLKVKVEDNLAAAAGKKYKMFSKEQISRIVELVNKDESFQKQAQDTNLTLTLAVKMDETNQVYQFKFIKGRITEVTNDENAEFLVSGSTQVWKAVFTRQIDPFVATTQKKLKLRGDFAKISRWYAPFARLFQIWQEVPIEG